MDKPENFNDAAAAPETAPQATNAPEGKAPQPPEPEKQDRSKRRGRNLVFACLMLVCVLVLGYALSRLIGIQMGYKEAVDEYDRLADQVKPAPASSPQASAPAPASAAAQDASVHEPALTPFEINPDYVGWMEIPDTVLDYPVVRGPDNDKYLNVTFEGVQNDAGTIFMDYRNNASFGSHHTLIYGHNLKNGRMFGSLHQYLDTAYMESHPYILITTETGASLKYRVFAARVTDMYDDAYRIDFSGTDDIASFIASYGGPESATKMLTLSTCTNNADEERLLVHAALEE